MAANVLGKKVVGNGLLKAGLVSRAQSKHNISSWSKKKKVVSRLGYLNKANKYENRVSFIKYFYLMLQDNYFIIFKSKFIISNH